MLIQIVTTDEKIENLRPIADALIQRQLAACCQIEGPIESVYAWKGKVESSQEYRCLIKTLQTHYSTVEALILEMHSYEQPQITATTIAHVEPGYEAWVRSNLREPN